MPASSQPLPYFDNLVNAWVFSRYADVAAAMRESGLVPAGAKSGPPKAAYGQAHVEMREATSRELSPKHLASWQRILEARADELLVNLPADPTIDLLENYGRPWCLTAAVTVTGADPGDLERLSALSRIASASAADPSDVAAKIRAKRASSELRRSFPPGPSSLRGAGFVALSHTLLSLLANMWVALAERPKEFARLHQSPGLLTHGIDELLRCAGVPATLYRLAAHDVPFRDAHIRVGQRVILKLSAAHRDAEVYPNPELLDLDRRGPPPLCLGMGEHSCVGGGLIRMTTAVATVGMTQRFNSIQVTEPLEWEGGEGFRTPKSLPARLGKAK
jgi:cytochrome P450